MGKRVFMAATMESHWILVGLSPACQTFDVVVNNGPIYDLYLFASDFSWSGSVLAQTHTIIEAFNTAGKTLQDAGLISKAIRPKVKSIDYNEDGARLIMKLRCNDYLNWFKDSHSGDHYTPKDSPNLNIVTANEIVNAAIDASMKPSELLHIAEMTEIGYVFNQFSPDRIFKSLYDGITSFILREDFYDELKNLLLKHNPKLDLEENYKIFIQ